jgi:hypothetical protein
MSAREQILQAMTALADTVPGVVVYRSREAALSRAEGTAILVRPEEETVVSEMTGFTKRDLAVGVTIIARGQIPDQVADAAIVAMHAAVAANQTLGGLCARIIEEATKWDFEVADQNAVAAVVTYRIRYLTSATTLASLT